MDHYSLQDRLIEEIFGSPSKIRVLRVLKKPGAGYMSTNQLAQVTSINAMTLSRALLSLQKLGIVNYIQGGKAKLWRLSEGYANRLILPILETIEKLPNYIEKLKEIILSIKQDSEVKKIVLFGSLSTDQGDTNSDIDLFLQLTGKTKTEKIAPLQSQLTEEIFSYFGMNPSFFIRNEEEWEKTSKNLKKNIQKGITLYEKNSNTPRIQK